VNWATANNICKMEGGVLASLLTPEELTKSWDNAPIQCNKTDN